MSVYVDELFKWPIPKEPQARRVALANGGMWCHLTADTVDELHAFAKKIGMKRAWFQISAPPRSVPHYDLTPRKREAALKAGAVFVSARVKAREYLDSLEATP